MSLPHSVFLSNNTECTTVFCSLSRFRNLIIKGLGIYHDHLNASTAKQHERNVTAQSLLVDVFGNVQSNNSTPRVQLPLKVQHCTALPEKYLVTAHVMGHVVSSLPFLRKAFLAPTRVAFQNFSLAFAKSSLEVPLCLSVKHKIKGRE